MILSPNAVLAMAVVGLAAAIDLRRRRIPNALTIPAAAAGIGLAAARVSDVSLASSCMGFAVGLVLMLPGYALGATGAGDVKLLAATGALVGAGQLPAVFIYTAVCGGLLALAYAGGRGRLGLTVQRSARLLVAPSATRAEVIATAVESRFPYGPAIAAGTALALW